MTSMRKRLAALLTLAALIWSAPAAAYDLRPIVVQLSPTGAGSGQTLVITNSHEVPIAIEVRAYRRQQMPNGEDTLTPEDEDLLIYPPQMVIPPRTSQSFKVQWVGDPAPARELAYRIVTEQLPIKLTQEIEAGSNADITVRYRYEAALYVMPSNAEPAARLISITRVTGEDGSEQLELRIASEGTMRAILETPRVTIRGASGESMVLSGEQVQPLDALNVLPGAERVVRIAAPPGLSSGPLTGELDTRYVVLQ
ncbi:molecular chaperone [Pelagerythrobacter aerophilus]|uniref:Molecular chaperone n=2 Tax=Pelagerythrobacter aerophilus TaxID=2306995 RepID=A0A418NHT4_9SPHN|nr:molecular chaperone [Pelagerythrobacter aerophilus]